MIQKNDLRSMKCLYNTLEQFLEGEYLLPIKEAASTRSRNQFFKIEVGKLVDTWTMKYVSIKAYFTQFSPYKLCHFNQSNIELFILNNDRF